MEYWKWKLPVIDLYNLRDWNVGIDAWFDTGSSAEGWNAISYTMGNEGSCAAVHQRIASKEGVSTWNQCQWCLGLKQTYFANCRLCSHYYSRCRQCFIHIVRFSFCLCPPVVRSVGCLPCGWLQTKIRTDCTRPLQTYRWKFWCARHSVSLNLYQNLPSSLPVVSGGCYSLLHLLYNLFFLTVLRIQMTVTCILKSTRFNVTPFNIANAMSCMQLSRSGSNYKAHIVQNGMRSEQL